MALRTFRIFITVLAALEALPLRSTRDYADVRQVSSSLFTPHHPYYSSGLRIQLGIPYAQSTLLKNRIRHPASKLGQMLYESQQHPLNEKKITVPSSGAHWRPGLEYGYAPFPEQIRNVTRPNVSLKFFQEAKKRMKEAMAATKHLRDKVHRTGWGAGIPYYTMNEDHVIVKKPGTVNVPIFLPTPNTALATISQVDPEENLLVPEEKPQTYEAVPVKQNEPTTQSSSHVNDAKLIFDQDEDENEKASENEAPYVSEGEHKVLGIEKVEEVNSSERVHATEAEDDGDEADEDGILGSTTMRVFPIVITDTPETTDIRLATTVLPEETVTSTPDSSSQYVRSTTATEEFGVTKRPFISSETGPIKFVIPIMLGEPASSLMETEIDDSIDRTVSFDDTVSEEYDLLKGVSEMHEATNAGELGIETIEREKSAEAVMGLKESEVSEVHSVDSINTVTERVVVDDREYTDSRTLETEVGIQSVMESADSVMAAVDFGTQFVAKTTHIPDEPTSTMKVLQEVRGTIEQTDSPLSMTDPGAEGALETTDFTNVGRESDDRSAVQPTDSLIDMTRPEVRDGVETTDSPKMMTAAEEVLTDSTEPQVRTELPIAVTYAEVRGQFQTSDSQIVQMESSRLGISEPTDTTTELTEHEVREVFGTSDLLPIANTSEVTESQDRGFSETTDSAIVLTGSEVRGAIDPTESTTELTQLDVRGVAETTEPPLMVAEIQVPDVIVTTDLPIAMTEAEVRGVPQTTDSLITSLEPAVRYVSTLTDLPIVFQTTDSQVVFTEHDVRDVVRITELPITQTEYGTRDIFDETKSPIEQTEPEDRAVVGTTNSPDALRGSDTQDAINTIILSESEVRDVISTTDSPPVVTIPEIRRGFQTTDASITIREPEDRGFFDVTDFLIVTTDSEVRSEVGTTESPVVVTNSNVRTIVDSIDSSNGLTESLDAIKAAESSGMQTHLEVHGEIEITDLPIAITEPEVRHVFEVTDSPEVATGTGERVIALTTEPTEPAVRTVAGMTDSSIDLTEEEVRNVLQTSDSWMVDPVLEIHGSFGTTDLRNLVRSTDSPIASVDPEVRDGLGATDSPNTNMGFEIRSSVRTTESSIAVTVFEDRGLSETSELAIVATESEVRGVAEMTDSLIETIEPVLRIGIQTTTDLPEAAPETEVRSASPTADSTILVTEPDARHVAVTTDSSVEEMEQKVQGSFETIVPPIVTTEPEAHDVFGMTDSPNLFETIEPALRIGIQTTTDFPESVPETEVRGAFPTADSTILVTEPEVRHVAVTTDSSVEEMEQRVQGSFETIVPPIVTTEPEAHDVFGMTDSPNLIETSAPALRIGIQTTPDLPEAVPETEVRNASPTTDSTISVTEPEVRHVAVTTDSPVAVIEQEVRGSFETIIPPIVATEPEAHDAFEMTDSPNLIETIEPTLRIGIQTTTDLPEAEPETEVRNASPTTDSTILVTEPDVRHVSVTTDSSVTEIEQEVRGLFETIVPPIVTTEPEAHDVFGMTDSPNLIETIEPILRIGIQTTTDLPEAVPETEVRSASPAADSTILVTKPDVRHVAVTTDSSVEEIEQEVRGSFETIIPPIEATEPEAHEAFEMTDSPNLIETIEPALRIGIQTTTDFPESVPETEVRSDFPTADSTILVTEPEVRHVAVTTDSSVEEMEQRVQGSFETIVPPIVTTEPEAHDVFGMTDSPNLIETIEPALRIGIQTTTDLPESVPETEIRSADSTILVTEPEVRHVAVITDSPVAVIEQEVRDSFETIIPPIVATEPEAQDAFEMTDSPNLIETIEPALRIGIQTTTDFPESVPETEVRSDFPTADSTILVTEPDVRHVSVTTDSSVTEMEQKVQGSFETIIPPIVATEPESHDVSGMTDSPNLIETSAPALRIGIQTTPDLSKAVPETEVRNATPTTDSTISVTEPDVRHVAVTTDSSVDEIEQEVRVSYETIIPPIVATEPAAHDVLGMTDSPNVLTQSDIQRGIQTTDMPITIADSELLRVLGTTDFSILETESALRSVSEVSGSSSTVTEPEVTSVLPTIVAMDSEVRGIDEITDLSMGYEVREPLATTESIILKSPIEEARAEIDATDLPTITMQPETRHLTEMTEPAIEMAESDVRDAVQITDSSIAVTDLEVLRVHPTTDSLIVLTDPDNRRASTELTNVITEDVVVDAAEANNPPIESETLELRGLFQTTDWPIEVPSPLLRGDTDTTDMFVDHEDREALETSDSPIMITETEVRGFTETNDLAVGFTDSELRDVVVTTEFPNVVTDPEVRRIIDRTDSRIAVTKLQPQEVIDTEEDSLITEMEPELRFAMETTNLPILVTESLPRNIAETLDSEISTHDTEVSGISDPIDLAIVEPESGFQVETDVTDSAIMMASPESRDLPRPTDSSIVWTESAIDNVFGTIMSGNSESSSVVQTAESPIAVTEPEARGAFDSNSFLSLVPEPEDRRLLETADSPNVETDSIIRSIFKLIESPNEPMKPEVGRDSTTIRVPPEAALQSEVRQVTPTAVPQMIDTAFVTESELRDEPVFSDSPITNTEPESRIAPETTDSSIMRVEPEVRVEADTTESLNGVLESEFATENESIEGRSMLNLTESPIMETKAHMESIDTTNILMEATGSQIRDASSETDLPNTVTPGLLDSREARAITMNLGIIQATAGLITTSTTSAIDGTTQSPRESLSRDDLTTSVDQSQTESTLFEDPKDSHRSVNDSDVNLDTVDLDHLSSSLDPSERGLLRQIPIIIEKLRRGEVTTEQKKTLRRVFGNLWPLFDEESSRDTDQDTNYNLATLIFRAGQRLYDPSATTEFSESMDSDSRKQGNAEAELSSTTLFQSMS